MRGRFQALDGAVDGRQRRAKFVVEHAGEAILVRQVVALRRQVAQQADQRTRPIVVAHGGRDHLQRDGVALGIVDVDFRHAAFARQGRDQRQVPA